MRFYYLRLFHILCSPPFDLTLSLFDCFSHLLPLLLRFVLSLHVSPPCTNALSLFIPDQRSPGVRTVPLPSIVTPFVPLYLLTLSLVSSMSLLSLFLALSSSTPPLNNTHQPASRHYNSTPAAPTVWHTTLLIFFPRFHRFQPEFSTTLCKRRPPARLYALPPTPQNARIHPFDRR